MIPGVSRSGATIMGSLVMGVERRTAAEFSFFLAVPTMAAATVYDLWKSRELLDFSDLGDIGIGFGVAFITALLVVKAFVALVSRYGFRSEEHTSELQSLMRISYAVFCLKKKTQYNNSTYTHLTIKPM